MAQINLCFVWHMHQPFYRDLVSGEFRLPWVRLHALKDYYGMVRILEEFPAIRQTFNLVPALLQQLEEYANGKAKDRFLDIVSKDAALLNAPEKEFLLSSSFRVNERQVIRRYPRYAELWEKVRHSGPIPGHTVAAFTTPMIRDLQVLSQLAWFDEEYLANDAEIAALVNKGRDFTLTDQTVMGQKQRVLLGKVLGAYREAAQRGQIEIATSPYYHPILPLLCDSNIADVSHPYVALPTQFSYPQDAAAQMRSARAYIQREFNIEAAGLWPPEGAVSDEVLATACKEGFRWTATDDSVLQQTLARDLTSETRYRPYLWQQNEQQIHILFRDRRLCELIGVVYARMAAEEAADHFMRELHGSCDSILRKGNTATVPIILDGENPWEHYAGNGRPFLRALYERISNDAQVKAVTVTEALAVASSLPLSHIFPGSWIDGNFDIWIGADEDNRAWDLLLQARCRFDQISAAATAEARQRAWEELMIAEGSDWCWWYGPEHSADSRGEFDTLFRNHLANVYRLLGDPIPTELNQTLLKPHEPQHRGPAGMIRPTIDGRQTSHAEWANAGRYRATHTSGPMHSLRPPIQELRYGSDGRNLYLWLGQGEAKLSFEGKELKVSLRNSQGEQFIIGLCNQYGAVVVTSSLADGTVHAALQDAYEISVSLAALHAKPGSQIFMRVEVWSAGLPLGTLPEYGELELRQIALAAYSF